MRLIGVDTPETVKPDHPVEPFGPEATQFTRRFLSAGAVHLKFDDERVDRFGRILAYVWVGDRLLNEELLKVGLARFEPDFHYSEQMKHRFRQAQEEAQRAGIGIWSHLPDGAAREIERRPAPALLRAAAGGFAILPVAANVRGALGPVPPPQPSDREKPPWPSKPNPFQTVTTPSRPT